MASQYVLFLLTCLHPLRSDVWRKKRNRIVEHSLGVSFYNTKTKNKIQPRFFKPSLFHTKKRAISGV